MIARGEPNEGLQRYEVTVGHHRLTVVSDSPAEAVRLARLKLCDELPRMWDVIQTLDVRRFRVEPMQ